MYKIILSDEKCEKLGIFTYILLTVLFFGGIIYSRRGFYKLAPNIRRAVFAGKDAFVIRKLRFSNGN